MNYVEAYYREIEAGRVITSDKVRRMYARLVDEIHNPRGPWVFDAQVGAYPIEFIEKFCRQSKGEWAGGRIKLDLWQKAFVQALFGFIDKVTGMRRFKEALLLVARKNGKSTLLSGIALYLLIADGEGGAEIYSVATKKDQARIVFKESVNMVKQSPALLKHIHKSKAALEHEASFSKFEPLASDEDTMDGLNSHGVIVDELHAIKGRGLYEVMKKSTSARRQPLMVEITTAGTVRESIYDDQYDYACKVVEGEFEDDRFLPVLYELDDRSEWTDPVMWVKANPGLGTIKKLEYLTETVEKAKRQPKEMPDVLTKDFNIRETATGTWLRFDDIDSKETFTLDDIRDCYAVGGADLSSTTDLTCATLLIMKPGSKTKYVLQRYFLPADIVAQRVKEDRIPYDKWAERDLLTLCEGARVSYRAVTEWFVRMVDEYGIRPLWVYYDSWNAPYWAEEMQAKGFTMVPCIQGAKTMSAPMKEMEADFKGHLVNYNGNPILKWCLTNTSVRRDDNDNIRPVKGQHQRQRIDGAVSLIDAYVGLCEHMADYQNMIA